MKKSFFSFFSIFALLLLSANMLFAQVTGGAVTGSVTDSNGAVIPNATVKLTDKARGQTFTATTTDAGSYLFPNVPVGSYSVAIEATGFSQFKRELVVSLNQTATVDANLQASGGTTVVDVVGSNEAIVQTDTSQVGKSFDTRKVEDLPINGNANNLAVLSASVIPSANGTANVSPVIGGIRNRGNSFNIDGVDNNDASVTGASTGPIQDAVSEFTLLQNNYSAEFGAGAGGQFNTITKSGTNEYHGNIFTYIGSQKLNARQTTEDGSPKNFFKEARYGGTFGGPLPFFNFGEGGPMFNSGKNKLFFFAAYEKFYQENAAAAGSFVAPTLAGLNQLAAIPGVSPFVINIFRNNVTLAPTADAANTAAFGNILGRTGIPFGNVILPIPAFQEQKSYQVNIDHLPNEKNQFRYRYSRTRFLAEQAGNGGLAFNNNSVFDTDLFSLNYIRTFNSNIINDLRISYLRTINDSPLKDQSLSNFPNLTIESLNLEIGPQSNLPQSGYDNNYQIYDSLTWVTGSHTFKFGADFRRYIGGGKFLPRERGDYTYTTFDLLLQDFAPDKVNIRGVGNGSFVGNNHRFFTFAQDDWKIRPNFTVNLGVRYEYQGLYRDGKSQITAANANVPGVFEFGIPTVDKNNFAPRIGFAWSPNWDNMIGRFLFGNQGESSIRGNFARSYFANFSNLVSNSVPPTLQGELQFTGNATNFLQSGGALNLPYVPNLTPAFLRANAGSYIVDQVVPYADAITFSYQRQLGANNGIEIRYLRTMGREMPVQVQLNARQVPNAAYVIPTFLTAPTVAQLTSLPTIASVVAANPTIDPATLLGTRPLGQFGFAGVLTAFPALGESNYDGLSGTFTRRFAKNVGFSAAYTLSKTEDNSTNELNTSALNPRRPQDAGNFFGSGLNIDNEWGSSPLDVRHRFVTSFTIDVPFFNNSSNALAKAVLGGFQLNGIFQAQSGQPITVLAGRDANRNGDGAGDRAIFNPTGDPNQSSAVQAVALIGGVVTNVAMGDTRTVGYVALNPNAGYISTGLFARELANQGAGTASRNSFRTRGYNNTDLVVLKNTRFGTDGRFNFQIGAEIFDLFNQRAKTLGGTVFGVGSQTAAFATAGNANFNNYDIGSFSGRTVRMRVKFFF